MGSISNVAGFLQGRAATEGRAAEDPEQQLLTALECQGAVPLPKVPNLLGLTPEQSVPVISSLRARNRVEVIERRDMKGAKFLRRK